MELLQKLPDELCSKIIDFANYEFGLFIDLFSPFLNLS